VTVEVATAVAAAAVVLVAERLDDLGTGRRGARVVRVASGTTT
jgi:hypothetical protein